MSEPSIAFSFSGECKELRVQVGQVEMITHSVLDTFNYYDMSPEMQEKLKALEKASRDVLKQMAQESLE